MFRIFSQCLAERYYVTLGLWHALSICRLSVTYRDLNFSAIFLHRLIAQELGEFVLKFWAKIRPGSSGSCKLNTKVYGKLAFFDQYIALFPKLYKIRSQLQWNTNMRIWTNIANTVLYVITKVCSRGVTFAYLIYWLVLVHGSMTNNNGSIWNCRVAGQNDRPLMICYSWCKCIPW